MSTGEEQYGLNGLNGLNGVNAFAASSGIERAKESRHAVLASQAAPMALKVERLAALPALAAALLCCIGCGKHEQRFESTCQLIRRDVVEENDKGEAQIMDIELEWDPCPGDQFQVVRGGKEFAACMQKYELGKLLPVLVKHWWDDRGYYVWDVYKVGDCARDIEYGAEGSYEKSQECSDQTMYGHATGFSCSRRPFQGLVNTCPWMARQ